MICRTLLLSMYLERKSIPCFYLLPLEKAMHLLFLLLWINSWAIGAVLLERIIVYHAIICCLLLVLRKPLQPVTFYFKRRLASSNNHYFFPRCHDRKLLNMATGKYNRTLKRCSPSNREISFILPNIFQLSFFSNNEVFSYSLVYSFPGRIPIETENPFPIEFDETRKTNEV